MPSLGVNDGLDATLLAGYQRFAVLLGDFSVPNFLYCLPRVFSMCNFSFSFGQFHVLGSIHNSVRRNEIHAGSTTARHGSPNHLAQRVFHCGYNIFLVKTIIQWLSNVHLARYELLQGAFVEKKLFLPLSKNPMAITFDKVQPLFLHHWCHLYLSYRHVGIQSKLFAERSKQCGIFCLSLQTEIFKTM